MADDHPNPDPPKAKPPVSSFLHLLGKWVTPFGAVVDTYEDGDKRTKKIFRSLAAAFVLLLVYPVVSLFAVMTLIRELPLVQLAGVQSEVRHFLITSLGVDTENEVHARDVVNTANQVVDMTFSQLFHVGAENNLPRFAATRGQKITFDTMVIRVPKTTIPPEVKCDNKPPPVTTKMATFTIRFQGSNWKPVDKDGEDVSLPIELGDPETPTHLYTVEPEQWEQIARGSGDSKRSVYPMILEITQLPEADKYYQCSDYDVTITVSMFKPTVPIGNIQASAAP